MAFHNRGVKVNGALGRSTGHCTRAASTLLLLVATICNSPVAAAIYRWDNGALITEKNAEPGAQLSQMDLRYADLVGAPLIAADLSASNLTHGRLIDADLTNASLASATLAGADLTGAVVHQADFRYVTRLEFTAEQFYSTASYQNGGLDGLGLGYNDLTGWDLGNKNLTGTDFYFTVLTDTNLSGSNLTNARFQWSALTNANLSGSVVQDADFLDTTRLGLTAEQIYSTASYQAGDLSGIRLASNDLSGWDFASKNLTGASFYVATLTGANFFNANLRGADLYGASATDVGLGWANLTDARFEWASLIDTNFNTATFNGASLRGAVIRGATFQFTTSRGFTAEQFYSTGSYQNGDLRGIGLGFNDLTGWDFTGKDLTAASFGGATVTNGKFQDAVIRDADLVGLVGFTAEQLYSTSSYQGGDLRGVRFGFYDMAGWKLAGKDLTDAVIGFTSLEDADFSGAQIQGAWFGAVTDFTAEQLYSTDSYRQGDLHGIALVQIDLTGWDFTAIDLTAAEFGAANLSGANFTNAVIRETLFDSPIGFTAEQLYSTASYQTGDLRGILLTDSQLSGWNFSGINLASANFDGSTLTHADLSLADLRGAAISAQQIASAGNTKNTIHTDGSMASLSLDATERLTIWDDDDEVAITVVGTMTIDPSAALRMMFEDFVWGSPITFEDDVNVSLTGSLELAFAHGVEPTDLVGATFDLFDWEGASVTGMFDQIVTGTGIVWDTSNLYTSGHVTLVSAELLLGDVNHDGQINGLDVDPFVDVLIEGGYEAQADMNQDEVVNGLDVDPFVRAILGEAIQPIPEPSTRLLCLLALGVVVGRQRRMCDCDRNGGRTRRSSYCHQRPTELSWHPQRRWRLCTRHPRQKNA